jgi:predicted nucleic acid-binding protein
MDIYLDTCCYGRQFDNQEQANIAAETIAVMTAIDTCKIAGYGIIGSEAVIYELENIRNDVFKEDVIKFYQNTITRHILLTENNHTRARTLQAEGLGRMDSYHLAVAEAADVKFLLTTDNDFERICAKKNLSFVKVINPLTILTEAINE